MKMTLRHTSVPPPGRRLARVAAAGLILSCGPSPAQNLVRNGDFEEGLEAWERAHASPDSAIAAVAREDSGHALRIVNRTGDHYDWMQRIPLSLDKRYLFQFELKRDRAGKDINGFVLAHRTKAQDAYYTLGTGQTDVGQWQTFAMTLRPPRYTEAVSVFLMNRLAGATAWFDNVQVVEVGARSAGTAGYRPALTVPLLETEPTVDGRIDEAEWAGAGHIESFVIVANGDTPDANTEAWVARTGRSLLIAARCREPHMDRTVGTVTGHDAGGVFGNDIVEIFLDPDNDHDSYYHFGLGISGADFDESLGEPPAEGPLYESGWTAKVHRDKDFWSIEAAIPFDSLHLAAAGDVWGLNLCRQRYVPGHRENSAWCATGTYFHNPRRFGDIVGLKGVGEVEVRLAVEGVASILPGESALNLRLSNRTGRPRRVRVRAAVASPSGGVLELKGTADVPAAGERPLTLPFRLSERGEWGVNATCEDAGSGHVLHRNVRFEFRVPPVLEARIVEPWWRGRIFSKMRLEDATVEAVVALREEERAGLSLRAELTAADGFREVVTMQDLALTNALALPVAALPVGPAAVSAVLLDTAGAELAAVTGLGLTKLAPAGQEVWLDRRNNLYINGMPHFPTGFYAADHTDWFERIRDAGYTLGQTYRTARPADLGPEGRARGWLNAITAAGLRAFVGIGYKGERRNKESVEDMMEGRRERDRKYIVDFIRENRQSPGLLGWYLNDEPSANGVTPAEMEYLYRMTDDLDPYHPKLVCQVHWSDTRFVDYLDVLMPDDYPIQPQRIRPLRSIAETVRTSRRTVRDEKPVWPVLQWYRYAGGRFPTPREMRCMAYIAVAAGAKGLTWFAWYHGITEDYDHRHDLLKIGRELRALEAFVLAPEATPPVAPSPEEQALITLTKTLTDPGSGITTLAVVAVNQEPVALPEVRFALPATWAGATVRERLSDSSRAVEAGGFTDAFEGYEPKVYEIRMP